VFGDALDDHAGLWAWPFLLCVLVVAGFVRYRVFMLDEARPAQADTGTLPSAPSHAAAPARPAALSAPRLSKLQLAPRAAKWLSLR
jgi:hypothetical protein